MSLKENVSCWELYPLVSSPERYLKLVFDIFKVRKPIAVLFHFFLVLLEPYSVGLSGSEGIFSPCRWQLKVISPLCIAVKWRHGCILRLVHRLVNSNVLIQLLLSVTVSQDTWITVQGVNVSFLLPVFLFILLNKPPLNTLTVVL